jgi:hypothetical protein
MGGKERKKKKTDGRHAGNPTKNTKIGVVTAVVLGVRGIPISHQQITNRRRLQLEQQNWFYRPIYLSFAE